MQGPWAAGLLTCRRKGGKGFPCKGPVWGTYIIPLTFIELGGEGVIYYIHYTIFSLLLPQPPRVKECINNLQICPALSVDWACIEKPVKKHFNLKFPRGNYKQEKEKNIFEIMKNTLTVTPLDSHLALEKYSAKGCILTGKRWRVERRGSSLS